MELYSQLVILTYIWCEDNDLFDHFSPVAIMLLFQLPTPWKFVKLIKSSRTYNLEAWTDYLLLSWTIIIVCQALEQAFEHTALSFVISFFFVSFNSSAWQCTLYRSLPKDFPCSIMCQQNYMPTHRRAVQSKIEVHIRKILAS